MDMRIGREIQYPTSKGRTSSCYMLLNKYTICAAESMFYSLKASMECSPDLNNTHYCMINADLAFNYPPPAQTAHNTSRDVIGRQPNLLTGFFGTRG